MEAPHSVGYGLHIADLKELDLENLVSLVTFFVFVESSGSVIPEVTTQGTNQARIQGLRMRRQYSQDARTKQNAAFSHIITAAGLVETFGTTSQRNRPEVDVMTTGMIDMLTNACRSVSVSPPAAMIANLRIDMKWAKEFEWYVVCVFVSRDTTNRISHHLTKAIDQTTMELAFHIAAEDRRIDTRIVDHIREERVTSQVGGPFCKGSLARQSRARFHLDLARRRREDCFVLVTCAHVDDLEATSRKPTQVMTNELLCSHVAAEPDAGIS